MRRGLTLIEVMLAVALLAGLAGVVATAYDGMGRLSQLEQQKLYAAEVAHRLILNYLLDPASLPDPGERIPYAGEYFYRHEIDEEMLVAEPTDNSRADRRTPRDQRSLSDETRFGATLKMITIRVYPFEEVGVGGPAEPLATLRRIYNPVDPNADDDVMLNQLSNILGRQIELPTDADPRAPDDGRGGRP
ncbi:MAG: prepilin-type N-terminal cleavage/methylation domain-containing protein [Planctomycetota bacterium]|nr:MAG: prepilin-type N-terminal cleavage/methylation domain-containing protein [Planctomycetota bacterium]